MYVRTSHLVLILAGVVLGCLYRGPLGPADAAPADVVGSPNVAVTSYKTKQGTYILWSDGRITKATDGTDLGKTYTAATGIANQPLAAGKTRGSPNVAVGVVPTASNTFVLFADGSVKKPTDAGAAAGKAGEQRVIFGSIGPPDGTSQVPVIGGSGDFTAGLPGNGGATLAITFEEPFSTPPTVVFSHADASGPLAGVVTSTTTAVYFRFGSGTQPAVLPPLGLSFVVVGE